MTLTRTRFLQLAAALPAGMAGCAEAQTSYVGPDGFSRYPGVTMLCPNGLHAVPCNFNGGSLSLSVAGAPVSASNKLPVSDPMLDSLIAAGTLAVGVHGGVSLGASTATIGAVSQAGSWTLGVSSLPPLPAGSNALGSVSVNNFPATQTVSGTMAQQGNWNVGITSLPSLPAGNNAIGSVSVSNLPGTQSVAGTLAVSSLPALPAGANAIGSVSVSNFPGTLAVSSLPSLPAGSNALGSVSVSNLPGTQSVAGTLAVSSLPALPAGANAIGSVSVSNFPGTQAIAGSVTLTGSNTVTLSSNTVTLAAGSNAIGTVTTVPSANNVPAYLQAVTSGGATQYSAVNAASSCMATNVKSTAGMVFDYAVSNSGTGGVWVRFFSSATAPSCGAGTPVKRLYVPAGGTASLSTALGWVFASGIGFDVTAGSGADTDSTVVGAASTVLVNIDYK